MKVIELWNLLSQWNPEAEVIVRVDGSYYPTDNKDEHGDFNDGQEPHEFVILTMV